MMDLFSFDHLPFRRYQGFLTYNWLRRFPLAANSEEKKDKHFVLFLDDWIKKDSSIYLTITIFNGWIIFTNKDALDELHSQGTFAHTTAAQDD